MHCILVLHTAKEEEEEEEEEETGTNGGNDVDIVSVYAERLSAVTHAFALCCQTVQKATRRCEMRNGNFFILWFL